MSDKQIDPKEAEKELIADIFAEGKLEDEEARMDVSIKPNYDVTGAYPEQEIADAIKAGSDVEITENITVGTDENGNQYDDISENVTAEG
jgi:hypothetical protein